MEQMNNNSTNNEERAMNAINIKTFNKRKGNKY